jgi:prepilin-type N-terminal cleavage/methylation domain-containing protein
VLRLGDNLRGEQGFTLVELLAAISIGMIILFAAGTLLDHSLSASDQVTDRVSTTQRGRAALDYVFRPLRSQVCLPSDLTDTAANDAKSAITAADRDTMTFYADLAETSRIQRRRLTYSGGTLKEELWEPVTTTPAYSYNASPTRTRIVAEGVAPQAVGGVAQPVFRYYAYANTSPPLPTLELSPPLSTADMARVVKVSVALRSESDRKSNANVGSDLENSAFVRGARVADYSLNPPEYGGPPCAA